MLATLALHILFYRMLTIKTVAATKDDLNNNDQWALEQSRKMHPNRPSKTGVSTILALNVVPAEDDGTTATKTNTLSKQKISKSLFGSNERDLVLDNRWTPNLRDQISLCSGGKIEIVPACTAGTSSCFGDEDIQGGVMDVSVANITGVPRGNITYEALVLAESLLGEKGMKLSYFTHVALVLPKEVDWEGKLGNEAFMTAGFALEGTGIFALSADHVDNDAIAVHEYGHTLGLAHSSCIGTGSAVDDEYCDQSCVMGGGVSQVCFNGAQSKSLGWYDADSIHIFPSLGHGFNGVLIGVADWSTKNYEPGEHYVVVTISALHSNGRLHLLYNRAKGPNSGVSFAQDRVTVTFDQGDDTKSLHKGALSGGEMLRVIDFDELDRDLIIEVAGMSEFDPPGGEPDMAHVLVYLEGNEVPAFNELPVS